MKMEASANGTGKLTAGELMHQLIGVPPEAAVHIKTGDSQMDGEYWSLKAEWDRSDERPVIPETPQPRHTPFFETQHVQLGGAVKEVRVPTQGLGGFAPVPTTGPITQANEQHYGEHQVNDWSNPYKGQWGDH